MKSAERTLATAGSHDFTDDDFFPDLGNLFLNDMGDNLNANCRGINTSDVLSVRT